MFVSQFGILLWPCFSRCKAYQVPTIAAVEQSNVNAQKSWQPTHETGKMAPPTGDPIKIPRAPQNMLMPKRVPIVAMLVVKDATAAPCKLTKAPEQNPYKKHQTARPAVLSVIAIQQNASKVAAPVHAART